MAATAYCVWQDVLDIFPKAEDIESDSNNQTALIAGKSNLMKTFLRNVHKDWLVTPYDEAVKLACASLVANELASRRITNDTDLSEAVYDHIEGEFTRFGRQGHSLIQSIRRGALVLEQDHAERDLKHPEAVVVTQVGTSKPLLWLPYGFKGTKESVLTIEITATGRVEDSTASWKAYWDFADDDPAISAVPCSGDWYHVGNGLYAAFEDVATTGNSYESADKYNVEMVPATAVARGQGPSSFEMYSG